MRAARVAKILVVPAVVAACLAGLGVPLASASTSGALPSASSAVPDVWDNGGTYGTLADCQASGQEALVFGGAAQYRCDQINFPDGRLNYYQLWLEY